MSDNRKPMSILRATAILGSSSIITLALGLLSSKVWALTVGPSGVGMLGLLQGFVATGAAIGGIGIPITIVREGASAISQGNHPRFAALRRAAWLLTWLMLALIMICLSLFPASFAQIGFGSAEHTSKVALATIALCFTLAYGVQNSLLNAHHRVSALAQSSVVAAVIGTIVSLTLALKLGREGIGYSIVAGSFILWVVSTYYLRREDGINQVPERRQVAAEFRQLSRLGIPITISTFLGGGMLNLIPLIINGRLGQLNVGYYRVASLIAINYLAFLLKSMSQDYYPRIAAASGDGEKLIQLINQQFRVMLLIGGPIVLAFMALSPYLIPLISSSRFLPAASILEWHLIGDLFKLAAWTMSFVILARCSGLTYFCSEALAGLMLVGTTWYALGWIGLAGAGFAFLASSIVHFLAVWFIVRQDIGFSLTRANLQLMGLVLVSAASIKALSLLHFGAYSTVLASVIIVLVGSVCIKSLKTDLRTSRGTSAQSPGPTV